MKNQLTKVRVFLLIMALLFGAMACLCFQSESVQATNDSSVKGILNYDSSKYTVTEDYTAYGQSIAAENMNSLKLQDTIQKRRLDYGKSGALFTSNATGTDATGEVFSIDERTGLFTMDLRVFSEKTFVGNIWSVNNTFLDVKKLSVTFTSKTNADKAFTIYYTAKEVNCGLDVNASVAIKGETYKDGNGYGMYYNAGNSKWQIADSTYLNGVAFSNFARSSGGSYLNPETNSIQMTFNPETMELFTNTYTVTDLGSSAGYNVEEKQQLCRNLNLNTIGDTAGKWNATGYDGMLTLAPADFANGYSISVAVEDMTANDVYGDESKDYDRYAKVLVYDVCGQKIKTDTIITATEGTETFNSTEYKSYQFSANTKNELAEDMSVVLDGESFTSGSYATIGVSPHYTTLSPYTPAAPSGTAAYNNLQGYSDRMYEHDPYSDIRGMEITFRSKTDTSKAFTVYLQSRSVKNGNVVARVGVEGESYRNAHGSKGFAVAGNDNSFNADGQFRALNGTFGASAGYSGYDNTFIQVRFNPTTMTVEGYNYAKWYTLRVLTQDYASSMTQVASGKFGTLSATDFAGGFTIEVGVDIMNNNTNRGRTVNYNTWGSYYTAYSGVTSVEGNYIMEEGYDRPAIFDVITFNNEHYHVDANKDAICDGCGEYVSSYEELNSVGLSLNGDIDMNYFMVLSNDLVESETAYLEVKLAEKTSKIYVKDAIPELINEVATYKFTVSVPAKDADEKISVQIKDGEFVGEVYEYSVKEYIQTIQNDTTGAYDSVKDLMNALDVYTDSAKNYFNNATVDTTTEMAEITADNFAGFDTVTTGTDERIEIIGCSLMLKSQTSVRIYFALSEGVDINDVAITLNEKVLTPNGKEITGSTETCYYVEVSGILASNLDMEFSVNIGNKTITTSAMAYARKVIETTGAQRDENLVNLMKSLYLYNQSADSYFVE